MVTLLFETMDMGCRPVWPSHHGMQDEGAVSNTACNTSGVCSLQGVTAYRCLTGGLIWMHFVAGCRPCRRR